LQTWSYPACSVPQAQKVHILKLVIDAFQNVSHIAILQTFKEKGNRNGDCGLRAGEQRWTEPRRAAGEAEGLRSDFQGEASGVDAGRPALKQCLEFLRGGDTLLVTKIDRLARSTSDLYRIVSELTEKGVSFKVVDDPSIDTTSRTGKLVMGILALIAEFENDIRRERQMDGIAKAKDRGVKFGRKPRLLPVRVSEIQNLRAEGATVPDIIKRTGFSKASIYRALGR
jgi:DNA invertase Pin-like site-specific DNA recombinase